MGKVAREAPVPSHFMTSGRKRYGQSGKAGDKGTPRKQEEAQGRSKFYGGKLECVMPPAYSQGPQTSGMSRRNSQCAECVHNLISQLLRHECFKPHFELRSYQASTHISIISIWTLFGQTSRCCLWSSSERRGMVLQCDFANVIFLGVEVSSSR